MSETTVAGSKTSASIDQQNEEEKDEIEEEFLKKDYNKIKIKLYDKDLLDYEFIIKKVMKQGCSRQIAEYCLKQYAIISYVRKYNTDYLEAKKDVKEKMKVDINKIIQNYNDEENKKDTEDTKDANDKKDKKETKETNDKKDTKDDAKSENENNYFDEEIDEIIYEIIHGLNKGYTPLQNGYVKMIYSKELSFRKRIKELFNNLNKYGLNDLKEKKDIYLEKIEPVLEASFRLVKKILNNDKEYEQFKKSYYAKKK